MKNGKKYLIRISPFKLENFKLNSRSVINSSSFAFKFYITSNKDTIHQIILSNYEMKFIIDLFQEFRKNIIQQICKSSEP